MKNIYIYCLKINNRKKIYIVLLFLTNLFSKPGLWSRHMLSLYRRYRGGPEQPAALFGSEPGPCWRPSPHGSDPSHAGQLQALLPVSGTLPQPQLWGDTTSLPVILNCRKKPVQMHWFDGTESVVCLHSDPRASSVSPDKSSGSKEDGAASGGHSDAADGHESVCCKENGLLNQKTE